VIYLNLDEALFLGHLVTGIEVQILRSISRTDLLDSALHAPQAGFGDKPFYPNFFDKAAVLCSRIALNHPLPDGNKRLAWISLVMFCDRNGYELLVDTSQAVACIVELAAGNVSEAELSHWIQSRAKEFQ
jgi:death-on-curing protein